MGDEGRVFAKGFPTFVTEKWLLVAVHGLALSAHSDARTKDTAQGQAWVQGGQQEVNAGVQDR